VHARSLIKSAVEPDVVGRVEREFEVEDLGLDDLAWTVEDGWLWLTHEGATVARVCDFGWAVWMPGESQDFAGDAEDGTAGMDAAEAALRRAGVLAEGVTVRRAVTL
jgi:hypothetical protein